jgi:hypothetical protein
VSWLLAVLLALYLIENLLVDGWVRARFAGMPALPQEPLSSFWLAALGLCGIVCVVLLLRVLVLHQNISGRIKVVTVIAVLCACGLFGTGYSAAGQPSAGAARVTATQSGGHQVTLKWNASTTPGVRYNVYRSETAGQYTNSPINPGLLSQTTYVDVNVASGHTYFYVTRAQDGQGHESANSNEAKAVIP